MKKTKPVNIYWEEFPSIDDQVKDVLAPGEFYHPRKLLNSTEVSAEPKPWLQKHSKNTSKKKVKESKLKESKDMYTYLNEQSQRQASTNVTLKDLNAEDKQKIAKLIRELAKFGSEKEEAVKELSNVKEHYSSTLKKIQTEKEQALKKHDNLREKLLEYEILVEELKQSSKHLPLNEQSTKPMHNESDAVNANSESSLLDNFSDLFMEQEKKFYRQQNILQEQIEQLQKLQESIVQQQSKDLREEQVPLQSTTVDSHLLDVGINSKKLETYILADKSFGSKQNVEKDASIFTTPAVASETRLPARPKHSKNIQIQTEIVEIEEQQAPKKTSVVKSRNLKTYSTTPQFDQVHMRRKIHSGDIRVNPIKNGAPSSGSYGLLSGFSSDSENEDLEPILTSPVQRKHFKPSSILEIVDGIQPRSTSTSVDEYSLKQSKSSRTTQKLSGIHKAYGKKTMSAQKVKSKVEEENVERNMLEEIFFMK